MTSRHLEELAIAQLGGEPWLLSEILPFAPPDHPAWKETARPGFFTVRRFAGPSGGNLYVHGESWADCAQQLGIIETSVETLDMFESTD